jgi:hypothetical protein
MPEGGLQSAATSEFAQRSGKFSSLLNSTISVEFNRIIEIRFALGQRAKAAF